MLWRQSSALIVGTILTAFALFNPNRAFGRIRPALIMLGTCGILSSGLQLLDVVPYFQVRWNHHAVSTFCVFFEGVAIGGLLELLFSGGVRLFFADLETQSK
jgi:hypothetical protein